jgi:hypothetical protein
MYVRLMAFLIVGLINIGGCASSKNVAASQPTKPACETFHNQCSFDVTINGRPVVAFDPKETFGRLETSLDNSQSHELREAKWQVAESVSGKNFEVVALANQYTRGYFGAPTFAPDVIIQPLGDQKLKTRDILSSSGNVMIGGQRAITKGSVLAENTLPPGEYVIIVRAQGTRTWDEKNIYVRVTE